MHKLNSFFSLFSEPNEQLQNPNHDRMSFQGGGNKNFKPGSGNNQNGPPGGRGNGNLSSSSSTAANGAPASKWGSGGAQQISNKIR